MPEPYSRSLGAASWQLWRLLATRIGVWAGALRQSAGAGASGAPLLCRCVYHCACGALAHLIGAGHAGAFSIRRWRRHENVTYNHRQAGFFLVVFSHVAIHTNTVFLFHCVFSFWFLSPRRLFPSASPALGYPPPAPPTTIPHKKAINPPPGTQSDARSGTQRT